MSGFRISRIIARRNRLALALALVLAPSADAATISVDTEQDVSSPGSCSLRDAIQAVSSGEAVDGCIAGTGTDTIVFADGVQTITLSGANGELAARGNLTIDGEDRLVTIQRASADVPFRVLEMLSSDPLTLRRIQISGGNVDTGDGAGILAPLSHVVLVQSVISGNTSTAGTALGGGLHAYSLEMSDSQVTGNASGNKGGGLYVYDAAEIMRSSIYGNSAALSGGGVWAFSLALDDSTINSNSSIEGSAITTFNGLTMSNSTIVGNTSTATEAGSAIALFGGPFVSSIHNSTISGNVAVAPCSDIRSQTSAATMNVSSSIIKGQCGASVLSLSSIAVTGNHDILDPAGGNATLPADNLNCDPHVLPLADNGGPTLTAALGANSCAIDHGANPDALPFDQRGEPYAREAGAAADVGAFELQVDVDRIFVDGFDGQAAR